MKTKDNTLFGVLLLGIGVVALAVAFSFWRTGFLSARFGAPASGTLKYSGLLAKDKVLKDISYCNNQKLDLYLPRTLLTERHPLVLFVHGGGWHTNNKQSDAQIRMLVDGLRDNGYAIASIDYREAPNNPFPVPLEDVLCSVRYLRANADAYLLDSNKFAIFGFSAGGNLAAMVGVLPNDSPFNNGIYRTVSSRVQAVVVIAGVFDFNKNLKANSVANVKNFMQTTPFKDGSPINYVSVTTPPFMLIRGDKDSVGLAAQDTDFIQKLQQYGVPYNYLLVKNAEHDLSRFGGSLQPTYNDVAGQIQQFIQEQLGM